MAGAGHVRQRVRVRFIIYGLQQFPASVKNNYKNGECQMNIQVIAGVNEINLSIADDSSKSVRQLIEEAKAVLGLTGQEQVVVNGERATVSTILKGGDKVEFVKASGEKGTVEVTFGVNQMSLSLDGKTVGEIVGSVKGILGLGGDEAVRLNGEDASAGTVVEDGDELEFVKASGEKGEARK